MIPKVSLKDHDIEVILQRTVSTNPIIRTKTERSCCPIIFQGEDCTIKPRG